MNNIKYLGASSAPFLKRESLFCRLKKSKAAAFYRQYLKQVGAFRYIARLLYLYFNRFNLTSSQSNMLKNYRLIPLRDLKFLFGFKDYKLLDSLQVNLPLPFVIPHRMVAPFTTFLGGHFPEVCVIEIPNAYCYSESNIVTYESYAIHHSLYRFESDTTSEEFHNIHKVNSSNRLLINLSIYGDNTLDCAANFMDACSGNYAHWLTEVLPRILIFCDDKRFQSVPILIDLDLHENIISSLSSVIDSGREIYFVAKHVRLKVNKLLFVDAVGYVPFGRRCSFVGIHSDGFFNVDALKILREKFCGTSFQPQVKINPRKIFLRRGNSGRCLINSEEIESFLQSRGYESIDTNVLSFIDQVKLFENVTHVISSTGAALANCLFCKEGTSILVLMGQHRDMIYGYWRNMLAPLNLSVSYLLGDIDDSKSCGIHGNFRVDLNDLKTIFLDDPKW